uniref:Carboxylic ester hydrolase n=1 Tax=Romanomermis culicivorax TaxID=13658 RepID=A0A915HRE1_ROMCU
MPQAKKPLPKQPWSTSRSATKFEPACLQFMDFHHDDKFSRKSMARESEDCLYLNVFAPHTNNTPAQKYPVLVWIHGGSFLAGSGDTGMDPMIILKRLVSKDVILVTMNYRLGALGFFSSISPDLRGNLGLWDQIEALKWIQQNIGYFGGDNTKVTLIGESAGAASVSLLAISPVVRGLDLAHRAIIMSGSSGAGWALERRQKHEYDIENLYEYFACEKLFNRDDLANIFRGQDVTLDGKDHCNLMFKPLQCSQSDTVHDLLKCFREKANFSDPYFRKAFAVELGVSKPIVDDEIIPYNVEDLLRKNAKIPIMIGVAEDEWGAKKLIYYSFKAYKNITNETIRQKIWGILEQSYRPSIYSPLSNRTMDLLIDAIVHYYIGSRWSNKVIEMKDFGEVLQN